MKHQGNRLKMRKSHANSPEGFPPGCDMLNNHYAIYRANTQRHTVEKNKRRLTDI